MKQQKYFKLHSCCQLVKGSVKSLIVDLQRKRYWHVPNSLVDFVMEVNAKDIATELNKLSDEDRSIAIEYIEFLMENELSFYCFSQEEIECFPELNLDWDTPYIISNAVIEIADISQIASIVDFFKGFYIPHFQFIFHKPICNLIELETYLAKLTSFNCKTKQILFLNQGQLDVAAIENVLQKCIDIELLVAFGSQIAFTQKKASAIIVMSKQVEFSNIYCGLVNADYFTPNMEHFTESQNYNTCLNRKISIDLDGNIKNCPSMKDNFGAINEVSFLDVVKMPAFTKFWTIKKDTIHICKDCEYRHICTDCRAYTQDPNDQYSKPLKCGYDPYKGEWQDWSTNPLSKTSIEYYGMQKLVNENQ